MTPSSFFGDMDLTTPSARSERMDSAPAENLYANDIVDGVACPVDPAERLACESCQ